MVGTLGAIWGIGGVALLLVKAIWFLTPVGLQALSHALDFRHWIFLAVWITLMLWSEAYRGFHQSFSPRVAARGLYLRRNPRPLHVALAPLFCLGLIHATTRRKRISIALAVGIVALIVIVRQLPQPWRGLVDVGVVLGLAAGLASMAYFAIRAFRDDEFDFPPEVPAGA